MPAHGAHACDHVAIHTPVGVLAQLVAQVNAAAVTVVPMLADIPSLATFNWYPGLKDAICVAGSDTKYMDDPDVHAAVDACVLVTESMQDIVNCTLPVTLQTLPGSTSVCGEVQLAFVTVVPEIPVLAGMVAMVEG